MSQFAQHTKIRVFLNGSLLFKEATVKLNNHSGLIPSFDVNEGLAGFTEGSPFCQGSVEQIVPANGSNLVAENFMASPGTEVTMSLLTDSGTSFTTEVKILNSDIQHGVNNETKYNFEFQGKASTWLQVS